MCAMCSICLDDISSSNLDYFNSHCNHKFHGSCIIKHIVQNNLSCPLCRINLIPQDKQPTTPPPPQSRHLEPPRIEPIVRHQARLHIYLDHHILNHPIYNNFSEINTILPASL